MDDIVQTATRAGSLDTLVRAVQAAGFADTLSSPGPFTLFAPADEAFAKLPTGTLEGLLQPENRDRLTALLEHHVIPGRRSAAQVTRMASSYTIAGLRLAFDAKDGAVRVGGAKLVHPDIAARNGIIHVIDSVVLPV